MALKALLLRLGSEYRVCGYWTGDFIGRLVDLRDFRGRSPRAALAVFVVTDPLRSLPKVREKCPFPFCIERDFHAGDHSFCPMRPGATVEVGTGLAGFEVPVNVMDDHQDPSGQGHEKREQRDAEGSFHCLKSAIRNRDW